MNNKQTILNNEEFEGNEDNIILIPLGNNNFIKAIKRDY